MLDMLVPVPRYVLTQVIKNRDLLANDVLIEFGGFPLVADHFHEFVRLICKALPRVEYQTILDSVRDVAGKTLTNDELKELSWRLAGNLLRLQQGIAVPPWSAQHEQEWAPVQVTEWVPHKTLRNREGGLFRMRFLAGTPAPMVIRRFWSDGFCGLLSSRIGFSKPWGEFPFCHQAELVNMRLMVLLDPVESVHGSPAFTETAVLSGLRTRNQKIIKLRNRIMGDKKWPCPRGYDYRCYHCHIGYHDCPAGCRPETTTQEQIVRELNRE